MYRILFFVFIALIFNGCVLSPSSDFVHVRMPDLEAHKFSELQDGSISSDVKNLSQYAFLAAQAYEPEEAIVGSMCAIRPWRHKKWKKIDNYNNNNPDYFPIKPRGRFKIRGIGYQLWEDTSARDRRRFALIFRGTDIKDLGDWYSNARWLTRLNPLTWDQYQQARSLVQLLKKRMRNDFGDNFEIISVGHSLGGGLAQQAAYAWDKIKLNYAFATSPVTGSTSIDTAVKAENRRGLKIYRVHEAGEILATPRAFLRAFVRLRTADPKITELRFNFRSTFRMQATGGGFFRQHSIEQLGCDIFCRVEQGRSMEECGTHK